MHRLIPGFLFSFTVFISFLPFSGPLQAQPHQTLPVFIIDCGRQDGVFMDTCFKFIQLATSRLADSGNFRGIRSISNHSFLYRQGDQVFATTFSEQGNYKNKSIRKYFFREYRSESMILLDEKSRYAVILGSVATGKNASCPACIELKDTLELARVNSWVYTDQAFKSIYDKNFLATPVRIEFTLAAGQQFSDFSVYEMIYHIHQKMYTSAGAHLVYSPVNIYSFLNAVVQFTESTDAKRWSRALSVWDLSGERRSRYLNMNSGTFFIDLHLSLPPEAIASRVEKIMGSLPDSHRKRISDWAVYFDGEVIFSGSGGSKVGDSKQKKQTLTEEHENKAERNNTETISGGN